MKLEEIQAEWAKDIKIDMADIGGETSKLPYLHNKYYNIYMTEGLRLKKLKFTLSNLKMLKMQYYNGTIDRDDLHEQGWEPFQLKVLKSDLPMYIDADKDIQKALIIFAMQDTKVNLLETIIRQVRDRGFHLKTILEWEKFRVGAV